MKKLRIENGDVVDAGTTIVCTDCEYRRETSEQYPTLTRCPKCGGQLTYEDDE